MLKLAHPDEARSLLAQAQQDVRQRWRLYELLAHGGSLSGNGKEPGASPVGQKAGEDETRGNSAANQKSPQEVNG